MKCGSNLLQFTGVLHVSIVHSLAYQFHFLPLLLQSTALKRNMQPSLNPLLIRN